MYLFQNLDRLSPDAILGLMAQVPRRSFSAKSRPRRRRVPRPCPATRRYSSACAAPSRSCSRRRRRNPTSPPQAARNSTAPWRSWCSAPAHPARRERRARTAQTPGGCGALRVGAELIRAAAPTTDRARQRSDLGQPHAASRQLRDSSSSAIPITMRRATSCASRRCWSAWTAQRRAMSCWCTPAATIRRERISRWISGRRSRSCWRGAGSPRFSIWPIRASART